MCAHAGVHWETEATWLVPCPLVRPLVRAIKPPWGLVQEIVPGIHTCTCYYYPEGPRGTDGGSGSSSGSGSGGAPAELAVTGPHLETMK